ncbi:MAG: anaerobic ribonucleoside-triphosphate reductase activating protein [Ignavibacteria bacterium]|nr:anaerobic ribonucleoside-triphosphate reductase activating protein [Ignavibacteria bacterium]
MKIAGIQKISLIDYPGNISTVLFTQGCNFRCIYCHNPQLVYPEFFQPIILLHDIFEYLEKRKNQIDAVVISGGEPTLHHDLPEFIIKIKKIGYKVKLDTNGSNPEMLDKLLSENLVDFIAMDIKHIPAKYKIICGVDININKIIESIKILDKSSINVQFRTTVMNEFHTKEDMDGISALIKKTIKIQKYKAYKHLIDFNIQ